MKKSRIIFYSNRFGLNCVKWKLKVAENLLKGKDATAFASFPRSGNTWLGYMLQDATGRALDSVYCGDFFESEKPLCIKTHREDWYNYTSAIHLVRHPIDVVWSFYNYKKKLRGGINESKGSLENFLKEASLNWSKHTEHWLKAPFPIYQMKYEVLRTHTLTELSELCRWLGYEISSQSLESAIEKNSLNQMKRTYKGWEFFNEGNIDGSGGDLHTKHRKIVLELTEPTRAKLGYV